MTLRLAAAVLAALPAVVAAGMNKNLLVPAYRPCGDGASTCAPQRESNFTFDSIVLKTPQPGFTTANKLALSIDVKGLRDADGALVTTDPNNPDDDLRFVVPAGPTTLLGQSLTIMPSSGLIPNTEVRIDVKNGNGKASYKAPGTTPDSGLFTESGGLPTIYDSEGKRLAVTGARTKR